MSDLPHVGCPHCHTPKRVRSAQLGSAPAQLEPRMRLAKVDTKTVPALAARFNIRSIPTLALFRRGR